MSKLRKNSVNAVHPSLEGGVGGESPFSWSLLLKVLVAVLTALAGALGLSACGRW